MKECKYQKINLLKTFYTITFQYFIRTYLLNQILDKEINFDLNIDSVNKFE